MIPTLRMRGRDAGKSTPRCCYPHSRLVLSRCPVDISRQVWPRCDVDPFSWAFGSASLRSISISPTSRPSLPHLRTLSTRVSSSINLLISGPNCSVYGRSEVSRPSLWLISSTKSPSKTRKFVQNTSPNAVSSKMQRITSISKRTRTPKNA